MGSPGAESQSMGLWNKARPRPSHCGRREGERDAPGMTSEKLSRYLKEVYLAQMLGLL